MSVGDRGTLVYVHGASDRAAAMAAHVARIEEQLAVHEMPFDVLASGWGDAVGAKLDRIGLALPGGPVGGPQSVGTSEPLAALLAEGPLSELERIGVPRSAEVISLPASTDAPRDADRLLAIAQGPADGAQNVAAAACRAAASAVQASPEYARARCADVPEIDLLAATARAVATTAAAEIPEVAREPGPVSFASAVEVDIAQAVLAMAAATLLAGYVGVDVGPGLKRWATDVLVPHRARLMEESFLGPADILRYLSDGEPSRRFVAGTLREAAARGGPVVALGNSLGGIILVETLAAPNAPRPDLLVTVGSQSPLLMTIGALGALDAAGARAPFQPWLNVYDRRDFLAFVAQPVWPDQPGIRDLAVDNNEGFPDSHGATYLSRPELYQAIRELVPVA